MPPTWDETLDAVQSAITRASGLASENVIWKWQNADEPPLTYISMGLTSGLTIGLDYLKKTVVPVWLDLHAYAVGDVARGVAGALTYECITAGTSAASGGPTGTGSNITDGSVHWKYLSNVAQLKSEVQGVREVGLEITCFTSSTADGLDAQNVLEKTKTALRLSSVRDLLTAVGWSPFDPGPVNYIPEIVAVKFRGRATCVIRCYMPAQSVFEYISSIETVRGTISCSGVDPDPVVIDYSV